MAKQFSKVDCKFGAPMGRLDYIEAPTSKLSLFMVKFVDGDYDDGGAYWGGGHKLYCARDDEKNFRVFVRAHTRKEAYDEVLLKHGHRGFDLTLKQGVKPLVDKIPTNIFCEE